MGDIWDRRLPRITHSERIALFDIDNNHRFCATSINLSEGGLCVSTEQALPVGTNLVCRFRLGNKTRALRAKVAWKRGAMHESTAGLGLQFLGISEEDARRLRVLVAESTNDAHGVSLSLPSLADPLQASAHITRRGICFRAPLPFVKLGALARFAFDGEGEEHVGTIDEVVLEARENGDTPVLHVEISMQNDRQRLITATQEVVHQLASDDYQLLFGDFEVQDSEIELPPPQADECSPWASGTGESPLFRAKANQRETSDAPCSRDERPARETEGFLRSKTAPAPVSWCHDELEDAMAPTKQGSPPAEPIPSLPVYETVVRSDLRSQRELSRRTRRPTTIGSGTTIEPRNMRSIRPLLAAALILVSVFGVATFSSWIATRDSQKSSADKIAKADAPLASVASSSARAAREENTRSKDTQNTSAELLIEPDKDALFFLKQDVQVLIDGRKTRVLIPFVGDPIGVEQSGLTNRDGVELRLPMAQALARLDRRIGYAGIHAIKIRQRADGMVAVIRFFGSRKYQVSVRRDHILLEIARND